jgi:hypothetical protein
MNARMFAALIKRNEQDYRKKTEKVLLQVLLHCRGLQAPQSTPLLMLPCSVSILEGSILTLPHSGKTIALPHKWIL